MKSYHAFCSTCHISLPSDDHLKYHTGRIHPRQTVQPCDQCGMQFRREHDRCGHILDHVGGRVVTRSMQDNMVEVDVATNHGMDESDLTMFFAEHEAAMQAILTAYLRQFDSIKFNLMLDVLMRKPSAEGGEVETNPTFRSKPEQCLTPNDVQRALRAAVGDVAGKVDSYTNVGSGWHLCRILQNTLAIHRYQPLAGHSYTELPSKLLKKKACINIRNDDSMCFQYCVIANFAHPTVKRSSRWNESRASTYRHLLRTDTMSAQVPLGGDGDATLTVHFDCFDKLPVSIADIAKFERRNPLLSVNVFTLNGKEEVIPLRRSEVEDAVNVVNLLYITSEAGGHYVLIKSMSRLLNCEDGYMRHYCERCLCNFSTKSILKKHEADCSQFKPQRVVMPAEGSVIRFEHYANTLPVTHVIYADLEASIRDVAKDEVVRKGVQQRHVANSYCLVLTSSLDNSAVQLRDGYSDSEEEVMDGFVQEIMRCCREVKIWRDQRLDAMLKEQDFDSMPKPKRCSICNREFRKGELMVRHHLHSTGDSVGFAHQKCNLLAEEKRFVPLVMHGGFNYDLHHFVRALSKHIKKDFAVIAQTEEKYKRLSWRFECEECRANGRSCGHYAPVKMVDSINFLNSSLAKLVDTFKKDSEFRRLKTFCRQQVGEDRAEEAYGLLLKKNLYPYEYVTSVEKLKSTMHMPSMKDFYSSLAERGPSLDEYRFAEEVWRFFQCRSLFDYHKLYLSCDVLQLADCFEAFRQSCMDEQNLDPLHYIGLPAYAWDGMLRQTGVVLDQLTDVSMYNKFESAIRGGVSSTGSLRHAKANNREMESYDESKPTSYIIDLDANNLYGHAMTQPLPSGDFRWMDAGEVKEVQAALMSDDLSCLNLDGSQRGMTLEVDLHYPERLHDAHNDYPLCPEMLTPQQDWLSPLQLELQKKFDIGEPQQRKLMGHFYDRKRITIHWYALRLYLQLGMRLTKVHSIIAYRQSEWLKSWVQGNAEQRAQSATEVRRKLYKDMNTNLYGKTLQSCRDLQDIKLKTSWKRCKGLVAKPTFKSATIFGENLVAVHMHKQEVTLNKPIYVGASILDYAKAHMYQFWYLAFKQVMPQAQLVMTDTDSLLIYVEEESFYEKMRALLNWLDLSAYADTHPIFADETALQLKGENRMALGMMKDANPSSPITEVVALCSKTYSFVTESEENERRAKGVVRASLNRQISHLNYRNCLLDDAQTSVESSRIQHFKHRVYTVRGLKLALSCYDDKRYICNDRVRTLAFGNRRCVGDAVDKLVDYLFPTDAALPELENFDMNR